MKKKQIVALMMSIVLMISGFGGFCVSAEDAKGDDNSSLSLENDNLRIVFEENGSFVVTNLSSGKMFSSALSIEDDNYSAISYKRRVSSELMVTYYQTSAERVSANTDVTYSSLATASVTSEGESVHVKYDFEECKVKVDVVYTLQDSFLSASVLLNSLEEYGEFSVCKIDLLPGFGAGTDTDEGYMFVPDGSGALIQFNNGETMQYQADVYGTESTREVSLVKSQTEAIHMPVFGIVRNDAAIFGIVDSGDAIASVTAFSGHEGNCYNAVYSGVNTTFTTSQDMFADNNRNASTAYYKTKQTDAIDSYTVLYHFLVEEDANYSGMSRVYREYLIEEKGLEKQISQPVLNVDVIGAIDVKKNFLGLTYYKPIALTTYEQTSELVEKLKDSGVEQVALRYIGWNNDGISNERVLKKLKVMRTLGGVSDFERMNETLDELDVQITYDVDFGKFYKGSKNYKVMNPFNQVLETARYLRSVYAKDLQTRTWYQLAPSRWNSVLNNVLVSAEEMELANLSLSTLTSSIYSDFRSSDPFTRGETKATALQIMGDMNNTGTLSGDEVNAYAFPYVDKIYATPSYTSGYFVLDEEIPFYQMVLHGYVDLTTSSQFVAENRKIHYLKAVETGSQLLYTGIYSSTDQVTDTDYDYLYGTQYTLWAEDAVAKYAEYQPLLEKIYDSEIVSHTKLMENVFQTVYANGVTVVVNYNDTKVCINGMEVAEYGFCEVMQ